LASVLLGVTLAFTVVGTILAVILGCVGLVSIARNRDRVTGAGYAVFGIVWGLVFTAVTLLALTRGELFGLGIAATFFLFIACLSFVRVFWEIQGILAP